MYEGGELERVEDVSFLLQLAYLGTVENFLEGTLAKAGVNEFFLEHVRVDGGEAEAYVSKFLSSHCAFPSAWRAGDYEGLIFLASLGKYTLNECAV